MDEEINALYGNEWCHCLKARSLLDVGGYIK